MQAVWCVGLLFVVVLALLDLRMPGAAAVVLCVGMSVYALCDVIRKGDR